MEGAAAEVKAREAAAARREAEAARREADVAAAGEALRRREEAAAAAAADLARMDAVLGARKLEAAELQVILLTDCVRVADCNVGSGPGAHARGAGRARKRPPMCRRPFYQESLDTARDIL